MVDYSPSAPSEPVKDVVAKRMTVWQKGMFKVTILPVESWPAIRSDAYVALT
jgi:hypothetical protein